MHVDTHRHCPSAGRPPPPSCPPQAFNSEDERKYGEMFANNKPGQKKGKGKRRRVDTAASAAAASESSESEIDEEDMVDLSSMLGTRAESPPSRGGPAEEDGDEVDFSFDEESESDAEDRHDNMVNSISALSKASGRRSTRVRKDAVEEAVDEGEFNVRGASSSVGMDALLGSLKNSAAFGGLKQKLSKLDQKGLTLAKPAAAVHVKKATRAVAYEQAKDEVTKWAPLVKARRELEHLSFPINRADSQVTSSSAELTSKFNPSTALEQQVAGMLGTTDAADGRKSGELTASEELELKELSPQERDARVKELRKLRAIESFYASKSKRIKKIKSKKYHRIKNKELKRAADKMAGDLEGLDPEAAQLAVEKAERTRALARASLRHKNTSKWAKHMLGRAHIDDSTRKALGEANAIDQNLRKKITLEDSDGDSAVDSDDDSAGPADVDEALKEVETMRAELIAADETPTGGLYGLKFMQRALARKKAAAQESLDELEADLNGEEPGRRGPAADPGRRTFGATLKKQKSAPAFQAPDDWGDDGEGNDEVSAAAVKPASASAKVTKVSTAVTVKLSNAEAFADVASIEVPAEFEPEAATKPKAKAPAIDPEVERASAENPWLTVGSGDGDAAAAAEDNPWLQTSQSEAGLTPQVAMDKFTRKSQKRESKLQRDRGQASAKRAKGDGSSAGVAVDLVKVDPEAYSAVSSKGKGKGPKGNGGRTGTDGDDSAAFVLNVNDSAEQKALIEQAFAGDNVVEEEFEEEKAALVDSETNKDEDVTLPGWGSWGGAGVSAKPKRKFIKKAAPQAARKDGGLKHVIIADRKDKKLERKKVAVLPFQYGNTHQFERTIRQPIGKEWNTASTTNDLVKPKLTTKAGTMIQPMTLTKSIKARSTMKSKK